VGNRKYVVVEVWISGVEVWQRLKVEQQDPQNVFPWLIGGLNLNKCNIGLALFIQTTDREKR